MDKIEKEEKKQIMSAIEGFIDENRVMNFSDSVFAFAATLLILKINLPVLTANQAGTELLDALINLWPQYLANIISFLMIGYYWLTHHSIFNQIKKIDSTVTWLNMIFLILLAFLPFPVDLYGDFSTKPVVIAFYSASVAMVGFSLIAIWMYASHNHKLIDKNITSRQVHYFTIHHLITPIVFMLSVPLAFIHPLVAQGAWLFVFLGSTFVKLMIKFR